MSQAAPRPSRHARRRARTRAALIDAARGVFAERGVEAATIQEIADAADVAKGSFYNHFESREELQRAVVEATLERLGSALDRSLAGEERDPARVVARSLLATVRACVADPVLGAFVLRSDEMVAAARAALDRRGRRDLGAGLESGRFEGADPELTVIAVAGAAGAVVRSRLRGELPARAEIDFVALVLRMLGVPGNESVRLAAEAGQADRPEQAERSESRGGSS